MFINGKGIPGAELSVLIVVYNKVTEGENGLGVNNGANLRLI